MDDITLGPLLNAAALANDGVEQLIQSPAAALRSDAAESDASTAKKKASSKKKPSTSNFTITNFLKHPDNDAHKIQTNQLLLETASRIEDAIFELEAYADILSADGSLLKHRKDNKRSAAANNIRSSILPLLQITANTLRDTGKCFAPYSGTDRLQKRNNVERRKQLMDHTITQDYHKSPELMMIEDFVKRSNWSPSEESGKNALSSVMKKRKAAASTTHSITLLKPRNGSTYTKSEVIAIAKQHQKGKRGQILQAMIETGFVPVNRTALYRLMKRFEDGEMILDDEWHLGRGRPSMMYPEHMKPKQIDCDLTFDDLDTGDNRVVVDMSQNKRQKTTHQLEEEDNAASTSVESAMKPRARVVQLPKAKKSEVVNPTIAAKLAAIKLPPPRDGSKEYKKSEFVEVIKTFIPSKQHNLAMRAAMHKGYVGSVSKNTLRRLMEKDSKGEPIIDNSWASGQTGRPPKASFDEINEIVDKIKQEDLRIYDHDDVKELLVEVMMKRGVVDEAKLHIARETVSHYMAILKSKLSPMYWKKLEEDD